jgi:prepilin-type N-terminal cleavage/methylation domain-containing protein
MSKGFTLVEMMIVVAIVGVVALVVVPQFVGSTNLAEMRAAARKVRGTVARARTLAATGKNDGYAGWNANDRTVEAGIEVLPGGTGYQLFVDRDGNAGDEAIIGIVNYAPASGPHSAPNLTITNPAAGTQIRFLRNGTLSGGANQSITVQDVSGAQMTIAISYGGGTEIQ